MDNSYYQDIKKLLKETRDLIPLTDEQMNEKVKRNKIKECKKSNAKPESFVTIHEETNGVWSFNHYLEVNELGLAWEELVWASERVESLFALGGGGLKTWKSARFFWRNMAFLAKSIFAGTRDITLELRDELIDGKGLEIIETALEWAAANDKSKEIYFESILEKIKEC